MNRARHEEMGLAGGHYRPLRPLDVGKMADTALDVLERSGVAVYSPEAFLILKRAGANANRKTRVVRFPRSMVEDAIASNPSSVTLCSRNGKCDVTLKGRLVHYGTGGQATHVLDLDSGQRRPSRLGDVVLSARLAELLDNIHVFNINVLPGDIASGPDVDLNCFFHALDNTRKHVMGTIHSETGAAKVATLAAD